MPNGRVSAWLQRALLTAAAWLPSAALGAEDVGRPSVWIDVYAGEPLAYDQLLDDLAGARVIYLGERHRIGRHHAIQHRILTDLAGRGVSLVLGLEHLESFQQSALDRFNQGEIDFGQLMEAAQWARRWPSCEQLRPILEAAQRLKIPVLALNARAETIRQVARGGGIARLDAKTRAELPADMRLDGPLYEKYLGLHMMVHVVAKAETLRPMIEAQIARDEAMAHTLSAFLTSEAGRGRTAVVLCGAGHVAYALGTPARVRRRLPEAKDRIILLSESGDLVLTPEERAMARPITITHDQLRQIDRPIADYLHVTSLKPAPAR
jgi:uncharacterized iron-regulated protein